METVKVRKFKCLVCSFQNDGEQMFVRINTKKRYICFNCVLEMVGTVFDNYRDNFV